ncbi:ABC transporter ATP-binding protein [Asticcacaulis machinosus]|uniref:ABC transporter ATP-binding protein n=1 Tax=Asticcacaulis machinosus TaxID=2984211 RepID=A0ABT5HIV0_9CAUL|nr:ABC transporter ATP-binding protein [Asticcacaulis machinosus]MDC7676143.1 ABC transporter ATP-binding protein [Asticcacaulis machinosus]
MALIDLTDIEHLYSGAQKPVHALRGVSLEIDAGEFVAITGASGSGKSTLLNIIGTLERASAGRYLFDGQRVEATPERKLANLRANKIGFVFQNFNLLDHLTVFDNIALGLRYRRDPVAGRRERILSVLDRVGLAHRADHLPRQLSGGQQQRCAIARAIVGDPQVVLADEPTGNLDSTNAGQVMGILEDINAQGATVIVVTHAPSQADRAGRIIELHDGRVHMTRRRLT